MTKAAVIKSELMRSQLISSRGRSGTSHRSRSLCVRSQLSTRRTRKAPCSTSRHDSLATSGINTALSKRRGPFCMWSARREARTITQDQARAIATMEGAQMHRGAAGETARREDADESHVWLVHRTWAMCICRADRERRHPVRGSFLRLEWLLLPEYTRKLPISQCPRA
jgi:hypothetical protein